jgi:transcriptional regulator
MYIPKSFRQEDLTILHEMMRQNNFATLVTNHNNLPFATHIPLYLNPEKGEFGALIGHVARANPQWQSFADNSEVLTIFHGAHAYVSPSWYEEEQSVPTWNYIAVHAYGTLRMLDTHDEMHGMLKTLVDYHESGFEKSWQMENLPEDYVTNLMKAIVGFEITITNLEGKYKLSQNRSATDQHGVVDALGHSHSALEKAVAHEMELNFHR